MGGMITTLDAATIIVLPLLPGPLANTVEHLTIIQIASDRPGCAVVSQDWIAECLVQRSIVPITDWCVSADTHVRPLYRSQEALEEIAVKIKSEDDDGDVGDGVERDWIYVMDSEEEELGKRAEMSKSLQSKEVKHPQRLSISPSPPRRSTSRSGAQVKTEGAAKKRSRPEPDPVDTSSSTTQRDDAKGPNRPKVSETATGRENIALNRGRTTTREQGQGRLATRTRVQRSETVDSYADLEDDPEEEAEDDYEDDADDDEEYVGKESLATGGRSRTKRTQKEVAVNARNKVLDKDREAFDKVAEHLRAWDGKGSVVTFMNTLPAQVSRFDTRLDCPAPPNKNNGDSLLSGRCRRRVVKIRQIYRDKPADSYRIMVDGVLRGHSFGRHTKSCWFVRSQG